MGRKNLRRSIAIASGKGGTGKTTMTANLGVALGALGRKVTILDGDLAMANLSIVMGLTKFRTNLLDVLMGRARVEEAVYRNYGINVIPTGFRFEEAHEALFKVRPEKVEEVVRSILEEAEFLLIDAPAGIQDSTILSLAAAREMIAVCNPTYTSLVDCYKTVRLANVLGSWTRGVVVNRTGKSADLSTREVEEFMGHTLGAVPVLAEVPEDPAVQEAEREGVPVVVYDPECRASLAVQALAEVLVGKAGPPYGFPGEKGRDETVARLVRALTGRPDRV
ncbi:MAG: cell division ATPase MinD [Candidatus Hadarchaeales archaeon]